MKRLILLSLILMSLGCGFFNSDPRQGKEIKITIMQNGIPFLNGNIDLSGDGGGSELDDLGQAVFANVPNGNYKVVVLPPTPDPVPPAPGMPAKQVAPSFTIPERFTSEATTPLQIEVKSGAEVFMFDLSEFK